MTTHCDGLIGLRPRPKTADKVSAPPYDVIKPGSNLEEFLKKRPESLYHATLGEDPVEALRDMMAKELLIPDLEPCYYVYEQKWANGERLGVFSAIEVADYSEAKVIRHEKTFDEKVKGRIALAKATGLTLEPIFLLTKSSIQEILETIRQEQDPLFDFTSDLGGFSELHEISNRVFRVPVDSPNGKKLKESLEKNPLYIADGHHRYHAALKNGQSRTLAYIVEKAQILAYNRVINGVVPWEKAKKELDLVPIEKFETPPKHAFNIYTREGIYQLKAKTIPDDPVGGLDCSILEKELYPSLGLTHDKILDTKHFDYYAENELNTMCKLVDEGKYEMAVALHPVYIDELMTVADAGLKNPEVVMPEKSTFFSPKILSGLFLYRHGKPAK